MSRITPTMFRCLEAVDAVGLNGPHTSRFKSRTFRALANRGLIAEFGTANRYRLTHSGRDILYPFQAKFGG